MSKWHTIKLKIPNQEWYHRFVDQSQEFVDNTNARIKIKYFIPSFPQYNNFKGVTMPLAGGYLIIKCIDEAILTMMQIKFCDFFVEVQDARAALSSVTSSILGVQPLTAPAGQIFTMGYRYDE